MASSNRILVKLQPTAALAAAELQTFRVGATLVIDLSKPAIQYAITKNADSQERQRLTAAFLRDALQDPLRALLIAQNREAPFASLSDIGGF